MKNKLPQAATDTSAQPNSQAAATAKANLAVLRTKRSKETLKHFLSPLEQAALRHAYRPFTYTINGSRVYISRSMCKHLLHLSTQKAELVYHAIQTQKDAEGIPTKLREVFDDLHIVFSLPPKLRNHLCRLECYTLFAIMQKGRSYFANEQGFSRNAMKTLDALFEKYNCKKLFK